MVMTVVQAVSTISGCFPVCQAVSWVSHKHPNISAALPCSTALQLVGEAEEGSCLLTC